MLQETSHLGVVLHLSLDNHTRPYVNQRGTPLQSVYGVNTALMIMTMIIITIIMVIMTTVVVVMQNYL